MINNSWSRLRSCRRLDRLETKKRGMLSASLLLHLQPRGARTDLSLKSRQQFRCRPLHELSKWPHSLGCSVRLFASSRRIDLDPDRLAVTLYDQKLADILTLVISNFTSLLLRQTILVFPTLSSSKALMHLKIGLSSSGQLLSPQFKGLL